MNHLRSLDQEPERWDRREACQWGWIDVNGWVVSHKAEMSFVILPVRFAHLSIEKRGNKWKRAVKVE